MSVFALAEESQQDPGFQVAQTPLTTFGDVFETSTESTTRNYLFNSKDYFEGRESESRDRKYREQTGRDLYEDALQSFGGGPGLETEKLRSVDPAKKRDLVDQFLVAQRAADPERLKDIQTSAEITETVKAKARESLAKAEKAQAGATGFSRIAGSLAGGVTASMMDPLNLATLPLGAGPSAGILRTALVEAGVNVGTEILSHPSISAWQQEIGNEYGLKDLAENVGVGAVFGAAFGGGMKAIEMGIRPAKSALMGEIANGLDELDNPLAATAARYEQRRLHVEESNPARLSENVDPGAHQSALREIEAAVNEGRSLDAERLGVLESQIRDLDPERMDSGLASVHQRMTEISPARPEAIDGAPAKSNDLLDFAQPEAPQLARQQQLAELRESSAWKSREKADFDEQLKAGDETIFLDDDGTPSSVDELRKMFKDDDDYLSAISSCGLGG